MQNLDKLNNALLNGDFFNPDRLPTKQDMMDAGNLDRKQTPLSGKYQTETEQKATQAELGAHPEEAPLFFRPLNPPKPET